MTREPGDRSDMQETPFHRCGGYGTVRRLVLAMYDRLLADEVVGAFFDDANMPNLVDHQTLFMSTLMGGPSSFSDEHIA